jgi:hypothetical protein
MMAQAVHRNNLSMLVGDSVAKGLQPTHVPQQAHGRHFSNQKANSPRPLIDHEIHIGSSSISFEASNGLFVGRAEPTTRAARAKLQSGSVD